MELVHENEDIKVDDLSAVLCKDAGYYAASWSVHDWFGHLILCARQQTIKMLTET